MIDREKVSKEQLVKHKIQYGISFAEEDVRDRARGLDDTELRWTIDELTKSGRIRGAVIQ